MKKLISVLLAVMLIFAVSSCATFNSEPTIVGIWKLADSEVERYWTFTADGYYVNEGISEGYDDCEFGLYEADGTTVDLGWSKWDYELPSSRTLILNGEKYTKFSRPMNNSAKIAGTWEGSFSNLGFSSDGLFMSMGTNNRHAKYSIENGKLIVDGKEYEYLIVNNKLFIKNFKYINESSYACFKRKTEGGKNSTSKSFLTGNGPWYYYNTGSSDQLSGTLYNFMPTGNVNCSPVINGVAQEAQKYSYEFDNWCEIRISNGTRLTFAIIDDTAFGFSF